MGVPIFALRTLIAWLQKVSWFLQAYANSAVCSATRTALITGRYQDRLSVGLDEPLAGRDVGLPPGTPTLPSLLKKAGYDTTLVGKWHLGLLPKYGPLQSGYDHFYGIRQGAADYYTHSNDLWDDDVRVDQVGYLTDLLGSHAVNSVNSYARSGRPFLLSLHFTAPHWPWEVPGDDSESKRLAGRGLIDFDGGTQQTYQRMIEDLDLQWWAACLRPFMPTAWPKTRSLSSPAITAENALRIHGPLQEERPSYWKEAFEFQRSSHGRRGFRREGRRTEVGISMDWLPTLLAAAGVLPDPASPPDGIESFAIAGRQRRTDRAQIVLAIQGERSARSTRRGLQVS